MGRFIYDTNANAVDIEDRTLAHLRIVMMNKLRRSEPFMFDVEIGDGSGRRSFWIHPSVPLQFHFFGGRQPRINRRWVDPAAFHTYAVDWDDRAAVFSVDGVEVRRCPQPPTYPMQAMVAVYDFPEWSVGDDDHLVPELVVDHVAGW